MMHSAGASHLEMGSQEPRAHKAHLESSDQFKQKKSCDGVCPISFVERVIGDGGEGQAGNQRPAWICGSLDTAPPVNDGE